MAAPNIVNVQAIYGSTSVLAVTPTPTAIVSNGSNSNSVIKINNLVFSNINTTTNIAATVDLYRGGTAYYIGYQISVPTNSSLVVLGKDTSIYLQEGDTLRLTASASSALTAVCSYETIS